MYSSSPPFEYERPFATFLLPSLLRPFRSRKARRASSGDNVFVTTDGLFSGSSSHSNHSNHSNRSSVASASSSSSRSSTSSQSPPSLCSSPSSYTATGFGFTSAYSAGSPSFATSLTAEPDQMGSIDSVDGLGSPHDSLARVLPDTLRCVKCSTDVAFAAQIVSKGFTGRHGRAYLVSAPPSNSAHLFAPEMSAEAAVQLASRGTTEPDYDNDNDHDALANIRVGHPEHRQLVTGAHVVADISCAVCRTKLGWKYVDARDASQRYKIGKFILETARVARTRSWEDDDDDDNDCEGQLFDHDMVPRDLGENGDDDFSIFGSPGVNGVVDPVGTARQLMAKQTGCIHPGTMVEFDSDDDDECEEIFAGTWNAEVVARRRSRKMNRLNKT
ncbi:yippee family protein [Grosmannia clavigera kw1407]|uniref:Yippee family protein n=1 Tax=Grosmannia clavigera (strain kw1407 / UAMH 11150) TaxID=655863 RepID=F0XJQ9_GROCL|nr:yippee family protein [Grosmannia clavigera kw1407]EFX02304.1 yippee family protein [Grosmannia clavigera kw1407]